MWVKPGLFIPDLSLNQSPHLRKNDANDPIQMVCPDRRVVIMEAEIDTLADELSNAALILKKSDSKRPWNRIDAGLWGNLGLEKGCQYCIKPCHGANRCAKSSNQDRHFPNSEKMSYGPKKCWMRDKNICKGGGDEPIRNTAADINCTHRDLPSEKGSFSSDNEYGRDVFNVILDHEISVEMFSFLKWGLCVVSQLQKTGTLVHEKQYQWKICSVRLPKYSCEKCGENRNDNKYEIAEEKKSAAAVGN